MRDEARHALPVLVVEDDADLREAIEQCHTYVQLHDLALEGARVRPVA